MVAGYLGIWFSLEANKLRAIQLPLFYKCSTSGKQAVFYCLGEQHINHLLFYLSVLKWSFSTTHFEI